jgi:hypothetical protein
MAMKWHDLLFMHWPVPVEVLRPLVPAGLEIDTFDGVAWLGVVPFRMSGIRARGTPAMPWVSAFAELNVRTYVTAGGRAGVWFFSLDAASRLAVRVARATFRLPYFDAQMHIAGTTGDAAGAVTYSSVRTHRNAPPAEFAATYTPTGEVYRAQPGDLDHWLTERYCLYAASPAGRLSRGEIHHSPWPLQPAACDTTVNTMTHQLGITLPPAPPLLHFAKQLDVVAWLPTSRGC